MVPDAIRSTNEFDIHTGSQKTRFLKIPLAIADLNRPKAKIPASAGKQKIMLLTPRGPIIHKVGHPILPANSLAAIFHFFS